MITPYKYRFRLGKDTPRDINGNYIVVLDGIERNVNQNSYVEFLSTEQLSFDEFRKRVEGTQGIINIYGDFKDDNRDIQLLCDLYENLVKEVRSVKYTQKDIDEEDKLKQQIDDLKWKIGVYDNTNN